MKRFKISLVALLTAMLTAAMAVGTVGVASASAALPEFSKTGSFTSTSGASRLETVAERTVECSADSDEGTITSGTKFETVVKFTGCEGPDFTTCTTPGANEGEIVTNKLSGTVAYLEGTEEGAKKVGLDFKPPASGEFAKFECTLFGFGPTLTVTGSLICPIKPVNTITTTYTLTCKQTKGKQEFTHTEGSSEEDVLETEGTGFEGFEKEKSAQQSTDTIKTTESGEIKA